MRSVSKLAHVPTTLLTLVLCAVPLSAATGSIPELQHFPDPLTLPAPDVMAQDSLQFTGDFATTPEKVVPRLWQRLASADDSEELAIIVELHQPAHRGTAAPYSSEWDDEQRELVMAIDHRFYNKAVSLLRGARGLSHFPLIFGRTTKGELQRLAALPEVLRVYADEVMYAMRTEGGALTKATTLRSSYGGNGSGIGVAVLDSGIDASHSELSSRVVVQGDFTGTTGNGTVDDNGHGTACAGIIAGTNGGMAPQASLWAMKVLKADGNSTATSVLEGLNAAYANRSSFGGLDIINMSLGSRGPFNSDCDAQSAFNSVFNSLYNAGIAIFVSSGNNGDITGIGHPACHSKVIAVGAVYDANIGSASFSNVAGQGGSCTDATTAADQITCYSDSGNPLDILAPSHNARTTAPGGGYNNTFGGTSAAAPYASGVAAQLLQLHPGKTPSQIRTAFMTTGKAITDVNGITRNRIDAVAAHQALGGGGGGGGTGPCVENAAAGTYCMYDGDRFEVKIVMNDFNQPPNQYVGQAILNSQGQPSRGSKPGFEWGLFYTFDNTNPEVMLKFLNACGLNNKIWVYGAQSTNAYSRIDIRDTLTGATKSYTNTAGVAAVAIADTNAFNCQ